MYINFLKKKVYPRAFKFNGFYILTLVPCDCLCKLAIREALGFPPNKVSVPPHHKMNSFSRKDSYTGHCFQSTEGTHQAKAVVNLACHTIKQRNCLAIEVTKSTSLSVIWS